MNIKPASILLLLGLFSGSVLGQQQLDKDTVRIKNGFLEGNGSRSGVRTFKGIPYAAPPVGELRWQPPQPVSDWPGVRQALRFGNRGMQKPVFGDMGFRTDSLSEDCLYLNVWTPAKQKTDRLPVLVYFYGGGLVAGDGSEPRYDGESMAKKGIVVLTVNYRLGIFGFFSLPELTSESPHHASGNYGYLDQTAALDWVQQNIAAFGGDPRRVTIAGESAGSISVFAQMASPLARGRFSAAIGESGAAIYPTLAPVSLQDAERRGSQFLNKTGRKSLQELRQLPAAQLLDLAYQYEMGNAVTTVDGYFFPEKPVQLFAQGKQAQVPLLLGWNSAEVPYQAFMGKMEPTVENYQKAVRDLYGENSAEIFRLYPFNNQQELIRSATDLASDRFIVYSTWKWADLQSSTCNQQVYRYIFSKKKPPVTTEMQGVTTGLAGGISRKSSASLEKQRVLPAAVGAPHAFEIEYALGNLHYNHVYSWTGEDYKVSGIMQDYFANFIKTSNPNGTSLPFWPAMVKGDQPAYMNIDVNTAAQIEKNRQRYLLLDRIFRK